MYGSHVRSGCNDEVILPQNTLDIVALAKDMFCLNSSSHVYVPARVYLPLFSSLIRSGYGLCHLTAVSQRGNVAFLIHSEDMSITLHCTSIEQASNFLPAWFLSNDN